MKSIQITKDGYAKLQEELNSLKQKKPFILDKVQKTRSMGDLSENNAYHAAREELSLLEGRIIEIETILKSALVIENQTQSSTICVGKKVTVQINDETKQFTLVGDFEADPTNNLISITSPIGQAVQGKKEGDIARVKTPKGEVVYKILSLD